MKDGPVTREASGSGDQPEDGSVGGKVGSGGEGSSVLEPLAEFAQRSVEHHRRKFARGVAANSEHEAGIPRLPDTRN